MTHLDKRGPLGKVEVVRPHEKATAESLAALARAFGAPALGGQIEPTRSSVSIDAAGPQDSSNGDVFASTAQRQ